MNAIGKVVMSDKHEVATHITASYPWPTTLAASLSTATDHSSRWRAGGIRAAGQAGRFARDDALHGPRSRSARDLHREVDSARRRLASGARGYRPRDQARAVFRCRR